MKKSTLVWAILFLAQLLIFSAVFFIYQPRGHYSIICDYDEITHSGDSAKAKYVADETSRILDELQSAYSDDDLPTTRQEMIDSDYVLYHLQLVENRKSQVIIRIYGADMTQQEVSSTYLTFDMTGDTPVLITESIYN